MTVTSATANFSQAVAAYNRTALQQGAGGMESREAAKPDGFAEALRDAAEGAVGALKAGEAETLKAAAGQADITDVVMAVSQAEVTLETVVALRDRVIQAYQDIINMPI